MKKLRIGVVGLGGIAQKAWLPVLAAASDWTLQRSLVAYARESPANL